MDEHESRSTTTISEQTFIEQIQQIEQISPCIEKEFFKKNRMPRRKCLIVRKNRIEFGLEFIFFFFDV